MYQRDDIFSNGDTAFLRAGSYHSSETNHHACSANLSYESTRASLFYQRLFVQIVGQTTGSLITLSHSFRIQIRRTRWLAYGTSSCTPRDLSTLLTYTIQGGPLSSHKGKAWWWAFTASIFGGTKFYLYLDRALHMTSWVSSSSFLFINHLTSSVTLYYIYGIAGLRCAYSPIRSSCPSPGYTMETNYATQDMRDNRWNLLGLGFETGFYGV